MASRRSTRSPSRPASRRTARCACSPSFTCKGSSRSIAERGSAGPIRRRLGYDARVMRRRPVPILAAAAVMVLGGLAGEARAQDGTAQAESLFEDGRRLLAQNRFAEACAKLTESERLD